MKKRQVWRRFKFVIVNLIEEKKILKNEEKRLEN